MKTINRRALAALVFGFLTLGTGASFAQGSETTHGCCARQKSCCNSSECCKGESSKRASAYNQTAERYRAKYGHDYPGQRPTANKQPSSAGCPNSCC